MEDVVILREHATPLHEQLLAQLCFLIQCGQLILAKRIFTKAELQRRLKTSRIPLRQASCYAEIEGLIERVPGRGTVTAASIPDESRVHPVGSVTGNSSYRLPNRITRATEYALSAREFAPLLQISTVVLRSSSWQYHRFPGSGS